MRRNPAATRTASDGFLAIASVLIGVPSVLDREIETRRVQIGARILDRRSFRKASATRRGVPRSLQPHPGIGRTRNRSSRPCSRSREKSSTGMRSYIATSAGQAAVGEWLANPRFSTTRISVTSGA